jgi:DNA repair ATPase RecN
MFKFKLHISQNDYKCLLEKIETFANLNCVLTTKIEHIESKAPSSTTYDSLVKKNKKLKAKLAISQDAIENLLEKMEIFSIYNNEVTTKIESIGSTLGAYLVEILEIIKNDASTSCSNLIDVNSNSCNQVLVNNVLIETCLDEIAMENELLRQEVAHLGKALYDKKCKAKQTQPRQDNTTAGVNNPNESETVVWWLCHKEGHKS